MNRHIPFVRSACCIPIIAAALFGKDFLLTPSDFPVLGELDPLLIGEVYEDNPDNDASYASVMNDPDVKAAMDKYSLKLLGGPLLGRMTDSSVSVWLRTTSPAQVQVMVYPESGDTPIAQSQTLTTSVDGDLTGILTVTGLEPSTSYRYRVYMDGEISTVDTLLLSFTTFPRAGLPTSFTIAFGGGARYVHENERMWRTILSHNPLALLLLGDNVYHDTKSDRNRQRVHYYRRQLRPEFVDLTSVTPAYAVWDDHDFCGNDCGGGYNNNPESWTIPTWEVFKENWVNPYYGGGTDDPGVWFDFNIGPVDFFMLDSRYYRNKGVSSPSMLGDVQKAWLLDKLKNSESAFKVIVSPVPMARGVKPGSSDPWDGYQDEREEIFEFMDRNNINGVFTLAADRHRSDIWRIPRPDHEYDLYEFMSSTLTNLDLHETIDDEDVIYTFNDIQSFGLVHFDFEDPAYPSVTFEIRDIDDRQIYTFALMRSELGPYEPPAGIAARSIGAVSGTTVRFTGNGQLHIRLAPEHHAARARHTMRLKVLTTTGKILSSHAVSLDRGQTAFSVAVPVLSAGVYLVEMGTERFKIVFIRVGPW